MIAFIFLPQREVDRTTGLEPASYLQLPLASFVARRGTCGLNGFLFLRLDLNQLQVVLKTTALPMSYSNECCCKEP